MVEVYHSELKIGCIKCSLPFCSKIKFDSIDCQRVRFTFTHIRHWVSIFAFSTYKRKLFWLAFMIDRGEATFFPSISLYHFKQQSSSDCTQVTLTLTHTHTRKENIIRMLQFNRNPNRICDYCDYIAVFTIFVSYHSSVCVDIKHVKHYALRIQFRYFVCMLYRI